MDIDQIRKALHVNYLERNKLMAMLEGKMPAELITNNNIPSNKKQPRLFNQKEPVPECLARLLKVDGSLTRVEVTRLLHNYLKEHDLIKKKNREIILDNKLKKIFGDVHITFYNIQSYVDKLY